MILSSGHTPFDVRDVRDTDTVDILRTSAARSVILSSVHTPFDVREVRCTDTADILRMTYGCPCPADITDIQRSSVGLPFDVREILDFHGLRGHQTEFRRKSV